MGSRASRIIVLRSQGDVRDAPVARRGNRAVVDNINHHNLNRICDRNGSIALFKDRFRADWLRTANGPRRAVQ